VSWRELCAPFVVHRRVVWTLAIVVFASFAYFVPAPAWNQNSRFALTRALVERGTTIIDPDHETTGDKSFRDGHFYCDKAPGASWLAAIPYSLVFVVRQIAGGELPAASVVPLDPMDAKAGRTPTLAERKPGDRIVYNRAHRLGAYIATALSTGVVSVLGVLAVWLVALGRCGGRVAIASACALTYGLATPAFAYSTALYGHQTCGALLAVAFAVLALTPRGRASRALAILVGSALAIAVTVEYTAAVVAVGFTAWWWWTQGSRATVWVVVAATPWALALAAYHTAAFGHPLSTGYDWVYLEEFAEGMRVRYGIAAPDPSVLLAITFGSYRGLFYVAPVLLLAVWGTLRDLGDRDGGRRLAGAVATACAVYYLLLNAGYYMWDGGAAIGPRHTVPMLGLLSVGLVRAQATVPSAFAVLASVSAAQMLLLTAAMPEAPQHGNPLWEYAFGHVAGRDASTDALASNLGLLLGLPGVWSLLPLLGLWIWAAPLVTSPRRRIRSDA
jgi:hypothetical protein